MRRKRGWTALVAGLAAMCLVLAGCGGGKKASSGTSSASKVEVFSWWTGGGEAKGLEAMVADFKKKHPEITFENAAVAGGSGTNAKAVLASRLQAHQPPDSFQGHAGAELLDYNTILQYTNTEAASTDWQGAAKDVVDGKAAFNIMGDWAAGYFKELNKQPKVDYDWAAAPGTDGVYQWLSDSFTLPKGAPHRDAAIAWLTEASSKDGQDLFNPQKGSIPARKDADTSLYKDYLAWALQQWKSDKLAGSMWHGVTANNAWHTDIDTSVGLFLKNKNVGNFQKSLVDAATAGLAS